MMGWYGDPGWGGWLVMSLMMLGFWALVIVGGTALFRSLRGDHAGLAQEGHDSAERILEERFARGEIDAEEYARRREALRTGR